MINDCNGIATINPIFKDRDMFNDLPLPPFGRVLKAYQQENICLDFPIYLFVGDSASEEAFAQKKMGSLCTFLPKGGDFLRYEWPVTNQKVIIYNTGGIDMAQLKKMSFNLLKFKPRQIYIWSENQPDQIFNTKKEF